MLTLMDSGAYTIDQMKKQGKVVEGLDFAGYCAWLKANPKLYTHYVNLDVISNGKATYDNWMRMRAEGLDPIAVYHATTDVKWLHKYLDAGCEYLCLGAVAFMYTERRLVNFDHIWANHLTDSKGMPLIKIHGFGLTSLRIITRYPWYSVDSSSWAFIARHGGLFVPRKVGGKFDFSEEHYKRNVSTRAPHKGSIPHINMRGPEEKKLLQQYLDFIETPLGKSVFRPYKDGEVLAENESVWKKKKHGHKDEVLVETRIEDGVINCQKMRNEANIKFFILTAEQIPAWPWPFKKAKHFRRTLI